MATETTTPTPAAIRAHAATAIATADRESSPYPHLLVDSMLPEAAVPLLQGLPFPAPSLDGVSGSREAHNATRVYFDVDNRGRFPICAAVAEAFQDTGFVSSVAEACGADLDGTYLRIEYAQDIDGFWLKPHTDIGVKRFTLLLYLSADAAHADLGTDIYADPATWVGRSPFAPNKAMIFVPSDSTWHGFEPRPITGVRRSLIINYVTDEWRAREQLSYPEAPVRVA